jgi:hypothetical protein
MINRRIFYCALILVFLAGNNLFAAENPQNKDRTVIKRYAVVIGANDGGKDRVKLRYAVSDAKSFLSVLEELGGVLEEDSLLLQDPDVKTFYTEMGRLLTRMERARSDYSRVEAIFYYSGHSDEESILLGNEKISYEDFRETINSMPADVHIGVLDSCLSGAFTRLKGGKKKLPFLIDEAYDMKGYAFMTSSSATEASQESDLIEGSFFTHYLISGMRGAADMIQDGRVTLNEAYQFTFNETLAETTKTMSGPQHPYYNIEMSGTGDVVITDIRRGSAILVLAPEISGRIFIHDKNNSLVVELSKSAGRRIELGLDEGEYRVINLLEGQVFESKIKLQKGVDFTLNADEFLKTDKKYTTPRGARSIRVQKETLLKKKSKPLLYGEFSSKTTSINGANSVILGGGIGLTWIGLNLRSAFSFGFAAYGKSNFVGGGPGLLSYGGLTFAYVFNREKKIHWRVTALAGSGVTNWGTTSFFIFEPGAQIILNLSQIVRIQAGISIPLVDSNNSGFNSPIINVGFQFGK